MPTVSITESHRQLIDNNNGVITMKKIFVPEAYIKKEAKIIKKISNIPYTKILDILISQFGFKHYNEYKDFINKKKSFDIKYIQELDIVKLNKINQQFIDIFLSLDVKIKSIYFLKKIIIDKIDLFLELKKPYMLSTYLSIYPILFNLDITIIESDFSINEIGLKYFTSHLLNRYNNLNIENEDYNHIINKNYINTSTNLYKKINNEEHIEILFSLNNTKNIKSHADFLINLIYLYYNNEIFFDDILNSIKNRLTEEQNFLKNYYLSHVQIPIFNKHTNNINHPAILNNDKIYLGYLDSKKIFKTNREFLYHKTNEINNTILFGQTGYGLNYSLNSILFNYIINNSGFILFDDCVDIATYNNIYNSATINNRYNEIIFINENIIITKEMIKSFIINKRMVIISKDIYKDSNDNKKIYYSNFFKILSEAIKDLNKIINFPYAFAFQNGSPNNLYEFIDSNTIDLINQKNINIIINEKYQFETEKILSLLPKFQNILVYRLEKNKISSFLVDNYNNLFLYKDPCMSLKDFNMSYVSFKNIYMLNIGEFYYINNNKFDNNKYTSFFIDIFDNDIFYLNLL